MRSKSYMLALFLLAVTVALAQSEEQGKSHADHFKRHFDPKESALRFDDPARDMWQLPDRVIAALNLERGQIVADIGAGTGYFTIRLAKSKASLKVYAVDIEPSMVSYLRERVAQGRFEQRDCCSSGCRSAQSTGTRRPDFSRGHLSPYRWP